MEAQGQRPLAHPLFATRGGYNKEATTSFSLSVSHALYNYSLQNINNNNIIFENVCPKSYLYIYDFRVIYTNVHTNRSDRSEPVLGSAGSLYLPSGGTCFPTALEGLAEAIVLLGKGILEGSYKESRVVLWPIEGENARYYFLDRLVGEVSKCESHP